MRYLFKALFALLIIIYTMIEAIMIYIGGIFYFIWALKWPKNLWQRTHNGRSRQILDFVGYFYSDNNIFHTRQYGRCRVFGTYCDVFFAAFQSAAKTVPSEQ